MCPNNLAGMLFHSIEPQVSPSYRKLTCFLFSKEVYLGTSTVHHFVYLARSSVLPLAGLSMKEFSSWFGLDGIHQKTPDPQLSAIVQQHHCSGSLILQYTFLYSSFRSPSKFQPPHPFHEAGLFGQWLRRTTPYTAGINLIADRCGRTTQDRL